MPALPDLHRKESAAPHAISPRSLVVIMEDERSEPILGPGTVLIAPHPTETVEILATPQQTTDRYRLRLTTPPGGGPGIRGLGPHVHPGFIERFHCVSGAMTMRVGSKLQDIGPGEGAEAPPGVIHGFSSSGDEPLVAEVEIVFTPPGPRPEADLVAFWAIVDGLIRRGDVNAKTGMPALLHLAVLIDQFPEAFRQPGVAGWLTKPLAMLGRIRGYR